MERSLSQPQNFQWICNYFELSLEEWQDSFTGVCPIHDGDNPGAFQIWPYQDRPYWECRTHGCHQSDRFKNTLIGFVRGLLSNKFGEELYGFGQTINFIRKNIDITHVEINPRNKIIAREKRALQLVHEKVGTVDRPYIRRLASKKENEPTYLINRGFSAQILKQFDVFTCIQPDKPLYNRCVVPIYCREEKILGYTGRTILPKCIECGFHHEGSCPTTIDDKKRGAKWYNLVDKSTALYNYWDVRTGPLCVAEGPGDVWKLVEHGLNAVALLGASPTPWQISTLARLGSPAILAVTDNDEAGENCAAQLKNKLERYAPVIRVQPDAHDVADSSLSFFSLLQNEVDKWTIK